jgi:TPR repeat protein
MWRVALLAIALCFSIPAGAQTFAELSARAEQNDAEAQFQLGLAYYYAESLLDVGGAYEDAAQWFRKAAEQGHAIAQNNLGAMYDKGMGVAQSDVEAVNWYRKAAEQGLAKAQFNLGVMYEEGKGVEQNDAEAVNWYYKAAEQGDANAEYNLGVMYEQGKGISQDDAEVVNWYHMAAEQDESLQSTPAPASAVRWTFFEDPNALARQKYDELFLNIDKEAGKQIEKDAKTGVMAAQYYYGLMFAEGMIVKEDKAEAVRWLKKAAEQGFADASYNLHTMYENGQGVPLDKKKSMEWLTRAAQQGSGMAQDALTLRVAVQAAFEKTKLGAEAGNREDQYRLATMYRRGGYDGEPDEDEAFKWLHKAAEQGHADAQYRLYEQYEVKFRVDAVKEAQAEMMKWCNAAAEQGHALAQYNLYAIYNIRGDKVTARMWLILAIASWEKHGVYADDTDSFWHSNAKRSLNDAPSELTAEQIKEAEKLALDWLAEHAGKSGAEPERVVAIGALAQEGYVSSPADKISAWKQAVVESSRMPAEKLWMPLSKNDYGQRDYSQLWVTDYPLGYIGNNYQRMTMTFEKVQKLSAMEYSVTGHSKVKSGICDFTGIFRVIEAGQFKKIDFGIDEYLKEKVKKQGYVIAEFILDEDTKQKNSGVFRGVLVTGWYVDMADKLIPAGLCSGDCENNNQFYGEWTSHKGGAPKTVAWGLNRIPMSGDLDMGAGEFSPADKYLDYGWLEYRLEQKRRNDELNKLYGR